LLKSPFDPADQVVIPKLSPLAGPVLGVPNRSVESRALDRLVDPELAGAVVVQLAGTDLTESERLSGRG
jgi:hypothetical protein